MPEISIVMAAYNCTSHIDRAVASLQAQTMADWELVVVDDASTDDTVAKVQGYAAVDPRIRLVRQPVNGGPAAARNAGLAVAQGKWFGILDADDAFRPERLERLLAIAAKEGADFVADNQVIYDHHAGIEAGLALPPGDGVRSVTASDLLLSERARSFSLGFMKPLIRRAFLEKTGVIYDTSLRYAEDFMFYAELLLSGAKAVLTAQAFYIYTTQQGTVSGERSPHTHTQFKPEVRLTIADQLWERYGEDLSGEERRALNLYTDYVRDYRWAHAMSEHKNARQFGPMLGLMLRYPRSAWRFILAQKPLRLIFNTGL